MVAVAGRPRRLRSAGHERVQPLRVLRGLALEGCEHCQKPCHCAPAGVVRSSASVSETKPTPRCSSSEVWRADRLPICPNDPTATQHHIDFATPGSIQQFSRICRCVAPEPTSFTCMATVHPRRTAYSRMADSAWERLLIQSGDSGIQAARTVLAAFCPCQNLPGFSDAGPCFMALHDAPCAWPKSILSAILEPS